MAHDNGEKKIKKNETIPSGNPTPPYSKKELNHYDLS